MDFPRPFLHVQHTATQRHSGVTFSGIISLRRTWAVLGMALGNGTGDRPVTFFPFRINSTLIPLVAILVSAP